MKKIALLVVLYNKGIEESETIKTLINYDIKNIEVVLVNNGPSNIVFECELYSILKSKAHSVSTYNFLENKPLSEIYNNFIQEHNNVDEYVIFDDDSRPQQSYMKILLGNEVKYDILTPKILSTSDNKIYYPKVNGIIVEDTCYVDEKNIISISSGISISKKLIQELLNKYGTIFDQRFALYGVDTSFFIRINRMCKVGLNMQVYSGGIIEHSLSRVDNEVQQSKFRLKERMYDIAISARFYPEYISTFTYLKQIVKFLLLVKFDMIYILLAYYFIGRHPRCNTHKDNS